MGVRRLAVLVCLPAVVLTAGACFATRDDVRTLQGDIATLRAEAARADSAHRAQLRPDLCQQRFNSLTGPG